jgi:hypothetical protein
VKGEEEWREIERDPVFPRKARESFGKDLAVK